MRGINKEFWLWPMALVIFTICAVIISSAVSAADLNGAKRGNDDRGGPLWTGIYIDIGGYYESTETSALGGILNVDTRGARGDIGVGADWRLGEAPVVVGLLARYGYSDADGSILGLNVASDTYWMVGGRAGFLVLGDYVMPYIGGAWMSQKTKLAGGIPDPTFDGFVALYGVELALNNNLSVAIEGQSFFPQNETVLGISAEQDGFALGVRGKLRLTGFALR